MREQPVAFRGRIPGAPEGIAAEVNSDAVTKVRVISERDGVRISDVADALRIAPRSATEVLDGLQARGLVERVPDPRDRRAVLVRTTAAGRIMSNEVDEARAADARDLFSRLSTQDRAALARILRALADDDGRSMPDSATPGGSADHAYGIRPDHHPEA